MYINKKQDRYTSGITLPLGLIFDLPIHLEPVPSDTVFSLIPDFSENNNQLHISSIEKKNTMQHLNYFSPGIVVPSVIGAN